MNSLPHPAAKILTLHKNQEGKDQFQQDELDWSSVQQTKPMTNDSVSRQEGSAEDGAVSSKAGGADLRPFPCPHARAPPSTPSPNESPAVTLHSFSLSSTASRLQVLPAHLSNHFFIYLFFSFLPLGHCTSFHLSFIKCILYSQLS